MADKEIRLDIGDRNGRNIVSYYPEDDVIVSLSTDRELFSGVPSVGNCVCGELDVDLLLDTSAVPRNGKIVPYVRDAGTNAAWKKKSEFFVFNRSTDEKLGTLKIVAYDAIYRSEQPMIESGVQQNWPRLDLDVMSEIAQRTGTSLWSGAASELSKRFKVRYPGIILDDGTVGEEKGDAAHTMREVAESVASMYAGNWIIDNDGKWRLIRLGGIPAETNYLVTEHGDKITIGGVGILV